MTGWWESIREFILWINEWLYVMFFKFKQNIILNPSSKKYLQTKTIKTIKITIKNQFFFALTFVLTLLD